MPTDDQVMRELLEEFLASGEERAGEFEVALQALDLAPGDEAHLAELRRHFHRLAGAGAIYDVAPLMALGRRGEDIVAVVIEEQRALTAAEYGFVRQLTAQIRTEFDRQRTCLAAGPPTAGADTEAMPDGIEATARQPSPAPLELADARQTPVDILVVDGVDAVQRLGALLQNDGTFTIRSAGTRAAAFGELDRGLPAGAILARSLPDGTGLDIVRELRRREKQAAEGLEDEAAGASRRGVPVLIVSLDGFLDNAEAIRAGADACFDRPADHEWEAIVARLHRLLERGRAERSKVLVVEDDLHQSRKIAHVLENAGYCVAVCDRPSHFDDVLAEFRPDLILLDIDLPDVNGIDLARYVRQDDQYATVPIVFLSSERDDRERLDAIRAGGDAHLVKPVKQEALVSNVAARLERARFIRTLLTHDGLTRLHTHTSFMDQAQAVVARKRRERGPSALAMIDIDHFKAVNDTYGHQAGDRVLVALAGLLKRSLRRNDVVGRYGGEEFAVLLDGIDERGATTVLMRLLHDFSQREHRAPDGTTFTVTFSAGVATFDPVSMDLRRWLEEADASLYAAKRGGRNRVVANCERLDRLRIGA
jgi:diguanylate cyclase (GGDEF)-like protein